MKKTIITLMISAGLLISAQVKAETIKATECTVNTQEDDAGSPHPRSLRGSLLYGYNRQGTGRACTEVIKFYAGVDFPGKRKIIYPENSPMPPVGNIYLFGLRFVFDYRHYFGGK